MEKPCQREIDSNIRINCSLTPIFQGIAYDGWRIEDLIKQLSDESIDIKRVSWGQGFKDMGPAIDALETAVIDNSLKHSSPVLGWCASNSVVMQDPAGARKLAKDKSYDRIDGMVALAMAIGLFNREPPQPESVYNSGRGLLTI